MTAVPAPSLAARLSSPAARRVVGLIVVVVLVLLPLGLEEFWVEQVTKWIPLAIAALGLNLLTGYNGQVSVGHGAFYGVGAYGTALTVNALDGQFVVAVVVGTAAAFVAGVIVGLPALRIKGLYLALVTLSVAVLFPYALEQFGSVTDAPSNLRLENPQLYRGEIRERLIKFEAPEWTGLAEDQWRYYVFLVALGISLVVMRNLVDSRVGRAMVAIRDNEVAAETNGVNVAFIKVVTFGISSAFAGFAGGLLALYLTQISPNGFLLNESLYFLVAVVIGGTATVVGPLLGALIYGVFNDVIRPDLPERWAGLTPLILGVSLIIMMIYAPGGLAGSVRLALARITHRDPTSSVAPHDGTANDSSHMATEGEPDGSAT